MIFQVGACRLLPPTWGYLQWVKAVLSVHALKDGRLGRKGVGRELVVLDWDEEEHK